MPALIRGQVTSPDGYARIVNTSSGAAYLSTLYWDTFKDGPERKKFSTYALYNQSKHVRFLVPDHAAYPDESVSDCRRTLSLHANRNAGMRTEELLPSPLIQVRDTHLFYERHRT